MRSWLLILPGFLLTLWPRSAAPAPIVIEAQMASSPPRSDPGTGVCATAVHVNNDDVVTSLELAEAYLARTPGMDDVDGRISFPVSTIDFRNSDPAAAGDYPRDLPFPFTLLEGAPAAGNEQSFAMRVRGYLNVPRAATYTFAVLAEDGYRLKIGRTEVLRSIGEPMSVRDSRQVTFAAPGMYPIDLLYFQNSGPAILELAKSNRDNVEVQRFPFSLGETFRLIPTEELYSALAGQSKCTECVQRQQCGTGHYCRDGLCQPCIISTHCGDECVRCPVEQPVCAGGRCLECSSSDTSACDAKGYVCDSNQCLPCLSDTQCGQGRICDTAFGQCIPRPNFQYSGGACSAAPASTFGTGAGLAAVLALLLLRRRRRAAALLAVILLTANNALAQEMPRAAFNAQTLRPAFGPGSVVTVEGTLMPRWVLWPVGSVMIEYANRPIRLVEPDLGAYANTIPHMLTVHVLAGAALTRRLLLGVDVPLVAYQGFDDRTPETDVPAVPASGGIGDIRLLGKIGILNNEEGGFGLAVAPQLTFPSGSAASFRGEDTFGIEPRVAADYRLRRGVVFMLNLGAFFRTYNQNLDFDLTRVPSRLTYGIGGYAPIGLGIGVGAEIAGAIGFSRLRGGALYAPTEGSLVARWEHRSGLTVGLGGGAGFTGAVGSPSFRLFASIGYFPTGTRPVRPRGEAQTRRRPAADASGSQMADLDGDGVAGAEDRCPSLSGPRENAGCPDTDADGDGLVDRIDRCPRAAGLPIHGGCPNIDTDRDGVIDSADECPRLPGLEKNAGCPEFIEDADRDGLTNALDRCPQQSGPIENLGCPDTDADGDGVIDRLDRCPAQAGADYAAGCPPFEIRADRVRLLAPIRFLPGRTTPEPASMKLIEAVAKALAADASIKQVQMKVSASGDKKEAKRLAGLRAKALILAFLDGGLDRKLHTIKAAGTPGSDEVGEISIKRGKGKKQPEGGEPGKKKKRKKKKDAALPTGTG